ncbi:MAG: metal-dependent hydrolase [Thermoplasmatota archaeon]
MADLLTHSLVAFSIGTILSWKFKRINAQFITILMIGSVLPDLTRIGLILESAIIENTFGVSFSWQPLHTIGGVIIIISLFTLFMDKKDNKYIFSLLSLGAISHLFLDAFLIKASGHSYTMFFPLTSHSPQMPGFYLSTDVWPVMITMTIAFIIYQIDKRLR